MVSKYLEHKIALLPDMPGIYMMKNINDHIIYIGKAKKLKNRVRSYFKSNHYGKTARLVSEITDFETIVTSTDKEALLLEITMIQNHQPYYNIKLKKGTGYPYIKITKERDPKMVIVSNVRKDGAYYFGPYPNVYAAEETMQFLNKFYPLRRCNGYRGRPCLYYDMGQCLGACVQEVPEETYKNQIKQIKSFLNGNVTEIKKYLTTKMNQASETLKYERAAKFRDQIHYIEVTVEKQKIILMDKTSRDIFNFYVDNGWISIQIFFIRQARLLNREKILFPIISDEIEEITMFIVQFYMRQNNIIPKEILGPESLPKDILKSEISIPIRTPQRGEKRKLLDMAAKNAKLVLDEKFKLFELDYQKTTGAMREITDALGILPGHKIEAFDHSHIHGSDIVSTMVVYEDGRPNKKLYRKYKLRTVDHADEAASTREVIRRHYTRLLKEHAEFPDLILIDGGSIQLDAAKDVLENELGLSVPVAAMVKNHKHKTAYLLANVVDGPLHLNSKSQGFYLLQRIQDEVHRFAISFHRKTHNKNVMSSNLDNIKGVGPKTRIKLLKNYGSLKKISETPIEELHSLGISKTVATTIHLTLNSVPGH